MTLCNIIIGKLYNDIKLLVEVRTGEATPEFDGEFNIVIGNVAKVFSPGTLNDIYMTSDVELKFLDSNSSLYQSMLIVDETPKITKHKLTVVHRLAQNNGWIEKGPDIYEVSENDTVTIDYENEFSNLAQMIKFGETEVTGQNLRKRVGKGQKDYGD